MLALFPAITVLISLYGLLFDPSAIERQLAAIRDVLPAMAFDLVAQRLHDLVSRPASSLSWGLVIGTVVALWSASAGIKSLMTALNIAYEEREKRGLIALQPHGAPVHTLCAVRRGTLAHTDRGPAHGAATSICSAPGVPWRHGW